MYVFKGVCLSVSLCLSLRFQCVRVRKKIYFSFFKNSFPFFFAKLIQQCKNKLICLIHLGSKVAVSVSVLFSSWEVQLTLQ